MDPPERRRRLGTLKARLAVAALVLLLTRVPDAFERPDLVALLIGAYAALAVALWALSSGRALRRPRGVAMLLDMSAISLVVWSTGGFESSWYLLYAFPILSASRVLRTRWSIAVTGSAIVGYAVACFGLSDGGAAAVYPFALRAAMLVAIALVAALPARSREQAEEKLLHAIEEIDRAILTGKNMERVPRSILLAAMELTNSELSAIRLVDGTEDAASRESTDADQAGVPGVLLTIRQQHQTVMESGKPLALPNAAPAHTAAWLVPLAVGDTRVGVLGVFSRRRLQYTHDDVRRLKTLAHLVAISLKNEKLSTESRERLQMLYDLGERLKSEQSLERLFRNVVELVSKHLGAEEAALFLRQTGEGPQAQDRPEPLKKVAVAGPTRAVAARLSREVELYENEESFTGRVFRTREPLCRDRVGPGEPHAVAYAQLLPSRTIQHYLGVPLLIGDEVLGVIRILNKKRRGYVPEPGTASITENGFDEDDQELLSAIATQVAAAIRNAHFVEQHAYFRNLLYSSPDPIIVIDGSGYVQNFNREAERLWGIDEAAVLGTKVEELYATPDHARDVGRALWEKAEKGEELRDQPTSIRKPGPHGDEIIPIRLSATAFLDKDGGRAGSIGVFTDEREVIRQTEERIATEKLATVGRLVATKGHDIKDELNAVRNWLANVRREAAGDPGLLTACASAETANSRALAKLQDMLLAAYPEPKMQPESLRTLLTAFEERVSHEARASRVALHVSYPEQDSYLCADADQIRQLFANLFGNSLDAIRRERTAQPRSSGNIRLDARVEGTSVLLTWCDDGCGMSEAVRAQVFMPMFTTKKKGNGLGLYIAHNIVQKHGGSIRVEPAAEGGACFTITLPLLPAHQGGRTPPVSDHVHATIQEGSNS